VDIATCLRCLACEELWTLMSIFGGWAGHRCTASQLSSCAKPCSPVAAPILKHVKITMCPSDPGHKDVGCVVHLSGGS
jgi:hypothetical protein